MRQFILPSSVALALATGVRAFDNSRADNIAMYWGQNSYGATHPDDSANWQKTLSFYCQDDSIDAIPIAFLNTYFSTGGYPSLDLSDTCSTDNDPVFPGTSLANCSFLASDIETCQAKGKIITLSLGGASSFSAFDSDDQATQFADTIWNLFLGGTNDTRPFGDAVLDGIDLDIESAGSTGYVAFATRLKEHFSGASKQYYLTAAPQCPFPDAYVGTVIDAVGFDAIYVQFYNNYCGLQNYNNTYAWNFNTWDDWAKNTSPNKDVKVYIGAPGSPTSAGSGYIDPSALASIAQSTRAQYSSFGGLMFWDASSAYNNNRLDVTMKAALVADDVPSTTTTSTTTTATDTTTATSTTTDTTSDTSTSAVPTSTSDVPTSSVTSSTSDTTTPSATPSTSSTSSEPSVTPSTTSSAPTSSTSTSAGLCIGVSIWARDRAYAGGDAVTYNSHTWQARWWSYNDTPGGAAGVWVDQGACRTGKGKGHKMVKVPSASASLSSTAAQGSAQATPAPDLTRGPASVVPTGSRPPVHRPQVVGLSSVQPSGPSSAASSSAPASSASSLPSASSSDAPTPPSQSASSEDDSECASSSATGGSTPTLAVRAQRRSFGDTKRPPLAYARSHRPYNRSRLFRF